MSYPAPYYAALHRGTAGDIAHYLRVCEGADAILELGCGYGRVLTALAAAGHEVVGLERDPELLALAREALRALPEAQRSRARVVEGDMRSASLNRRFDRILVPFGGLYCLLDDADLQATLATVVRHLAPGGRFAFDVYAADSFHEHSEPEDVPDDAHTPLTRVEVDGVAHEVLERSVWDKPNQRIDVSYLYIDEVGHCLEGTIAQRYLLEPQLRAALATAGLELLTLAHRFESNDADDETDDLLIVTAHASEL